MLFLSVLAVLAAEPRFVAASSANLRASADAKADLVTRLPIGAEVSVLETKGEWARVQRGAAQGWVLGELLEKEKPTLETMNARFDAAKKDDVAGRRKWAERAAALAPDDVAVLARLADVLDRSGDRAAIEKARMGLAKARAKTGVVSVAAIHIHLVYDKGGELSDCLNENAQLASALWNTIIGEGTSGGASKATALKIEVYGPAGTTPAGRSLEVEVLEDGRAKQKAKLKLGPLDASGESRYDVKVKDTGCGALKITARLTGPGAPSELTSDVAFDCGE